MTAALYKSEAEIAKLVGVPIEQWRAMASVWDRQGLPPIDLQTDKRYWPAVKAFLDRRHGLGQDSIVGFAPDGEEHPEHARSQRRARN